MRAPSYFSAALWVISLVTGACPLAVRADAPDPIPGWTHGASNSDGDGQPGIVLSGGPVTYSAPVIAEIDGDSSNGKEVAVGGADGLLYVYRADGSRLWTAQLPIYGCGGLGGTNKLLSSPAVGELFGDGIPYIVVGYGGVASKACDGGIVAIRGTDGARLWNLNLKKFAKRERFFSLSSTVFSSPALADTDGDGKMEIGFGAFDRNVYLLNANGSLRWYYQAADTVWSSPAFADVNGDGRLEMIIGTDISGNTRLRPITRDGGYVYAFKTQDRKGARINFRQKDGFFWQTAFDQVIYSSPVIADVLPNNPGAEVLVGSGCFFPQNRSAKRGRWIKILRLRDGKVLQTLTTPACSSSAPAVGDLDDDGVLEVIATVNGASEIGGDGQGKVMAWKAAVNTPLWTVEPLDRGRSDDYSGNFSSPVVADVDGNGSLEVVTSYGGSLQIFNGKDGQALTCQSRPCSSAVLSTNSSLRNTPAAADLNGDGILDLVAAGADGASGQLYGFTNLAEVLTTPAGGQEPYSAPWPMYRGNSAHTAAIIP